MTPAAPARRGFPRIAIVLIAVTTLACATALFFRTQIQSRLWAARVITAANPADHAAYLTLLCNAADAGRWGTETLLTHRDPTVRQHGVVVLHHVRTAWSRERLTQLLSDADPAVAELAALGLAIHGDESVIPTLRELFERGQPDAARAACVALGRLATPAAIATLTDLIGPQRDVQRAAALVDALDDVDTAAAVPALLKLLDDDRQCSLPTRRDSLGSNVLAGLTGAAETIPGMIAGHADESDSENSTIAQRAADALGRITGIVQPHTSTMPVAARAAARAAWQAWYDELLAPAAAHERP